MTWPEAVAFCHWLTEQARLHPVLLPDKAMAARLDQGWSIRLPTEQEWVKAARGWDDRMYPWGGQEYKVGYANVDETEKKTGPSYLRQTSAMGMYPQGASPFSVEEMSGNVWEYCLNKYKSPNELGMDGTGWRSIRGGSWYSIAEGSSVAAQVVDVVLGGLSVSRGFRVVCAVSPSLGALSL